MFQRNLWRLSVLTHASMHPSHPPQGQLRWDFSGPCPVWLWISERLSTASLGNLLQFFITLLLDILFLTSYQIFPCNFSHCLFSFCFIPLRKVCLHHLHTLLVDNWRQQQDCPFSKFSFLFPKVLILKEDIDQYLLWWDFFFSFWIFVSTHTELSEVAEDINGYK